MGGQIEATGPDWSTEGIANAELAEGAIAKGRIGDEPVLMVRCNGEAYAIGASCSHYGGPLADGIVADGTIRCPWHHARFDLATGESTRPPALNAIACYRVEARGDRLFAIGKKELENKTTIGRPRSVAIIGSGAAGAAVAEGLRREGYAGTITLFGSDPDDPVDRPNLSKDFLAGSAPEEWITLRGADFFAEHKIDVQRREVKALGDVDADAKVIATGAIPIRLPIPGAERAELLRSFTDTKRIIAKLGNVKRAVVIGAGFIGLEVAASLRARGIEVDVVGRETLPLEHIIGKELASLIRDVHVGKGVRFHLGRTPSTIGDEVTLDDGTKLPADLVIMGVGVRPNVAIAEAAGIKVDRGIVVDDQFRTSLANVWACGDVARYPDPFSGQSIRVEHWAAAQQQGFAVARSILGRGKPFREVPFFWSAHHDVTINYVGHAEKWDRTQVEGSITDRDCKVSYLANDKVLAVATINRDLDSLRAELAIERQ